jgi:hypothetical protein
MPVTGRFQLGLREQRYSGGQKAVKIFEIADQTIVKS